ncbi:helix-turn-helix domain-containing protein [Streptomyces sp. NPDC053048]|uniref:helix-turn-helix domain-containing protein n=1 Tax=Streptomyces sp. NPDC053048 TaxID=3365694 RepID=UPI0037D378F8
MSAPSYSSSPTSSSAVMRHLRDPYVGATALGIMLGHQLRALREEAGITPAAAADRIRGSTSKISRMETASSPLKERDVDDLLQLYGVGEAARSEYRRLVRRSAEPGWWQQYGDVLPDWLETLVGLERDAHVIRAYEVQFVPGLLQTPAYARAVVHSGHRLASPEEIERRVDLRSTRQGMLAEPGSPVLWAVIDESVLHRCMGGEEVMREQIEYLLAVTRRPGVTLQVAPYDLGHSVSVGPSLTYLRFAAPILPDIVYIELMNSALYLDKRDDVARYLAALDELSALALTPTESRHLLREALDRYR